MINSSKPVPAPVADAVTDWRGLRLLVLVLAALVLTVAAFGAWCLVQVVDARTQERLVAQQNTEADLWARMLTARMGGAIGFHPGAERGSVFWFSLPLSERQRTATAPPPATTANDAKVQSESVACSGDGSA